MFPFESVPKRSKKPGQKIRLFAWLGIKNDYRTLVDLGSVNVVEKSEEDDEDEGDE